MTNEPTIRDLHIAALLKTELVLNEETEYLVDQLDEADHIGVYDFRTGADFPLDHNFVHAVEQKVCIDLDSWFVYGAQLGVQADGWGQRTKNLRTASPETCLRALWRAGLLEVK